MAGLVVVFDPSDGESDSSFLPPLVANLVVVFDPSSGESDSSF